jgi:hypothetical protein
LEFGRDEVASFRVRLWTKASETAWADASGVVESDVEECDR